MVGFRRDGHICSHIHQNQQNYNVRTVATLAWISAY